MTGRAIRSATPAALLLCLVTAAAGLAAPPPLSISIRSRAVRPGEILVVTVNAPATTTDVTVDAFGHHWPAAKTGESTWRALVGIDLDQHAGAHALVVDARTPEVLTARRQLTVVPRQFRRRTLSVAPEFVNPPPEVQARIVSESAFMADVYGHSTMDAAWLTGFTRPVPGAANSSFGTRSVFNGEARSPHAGTDFLSGAGTPIHAPAAGRIVAARDLFFTGNTVVIDHGMGVFSMLAHMSRIDVREGDPVARGDIVGLVGATGRVTGPHLHWALRIGPARVDALSALALLGTTP